MTYYLTAGPLEGYRTYILTGLAALTVIAHWALGDATAADAINDLWKLFMAGGVAALRSAV